MNDIGIEYQPALKAALKKDVTIAMPFHNRIKYFKHYLGEGFWDGFRLQLVCDGSPIQMVKSLHSLEDSNIELNIHSYPMNQGVAYARSKAIGIITTPYLVFCDDDDFLIDGHAFLDNALPAMQRDGNTLFYAMRNIYAFNENLEIHRQYDRCIFHGRTGKELLIYMVHTGEISVLSLGSVFEVSSLRGTEPEPFFKVSEDFVFLARLCAQHPEKKVSVGNDSGGYLRLTQHDSLSSRHTFSIEKLVMHYVAIFVGAYYLEKMQGITPEGFRNVLGKRGALLQSSYRKGAELAKLMVLLHEKKHIEHIKNLNLSDEQRTGLNFLLANIGNLPPEFLAKVNWEVNAVSANS